MAGIVLHPCFSFLNWICCLLEEDVIYLSETPHSWRLKISHSLVPQQITRCIFTKSVPPLLFLRNSTSWAWNIAISLLSLLLKEPEGTWGCQSGVLWHLTSHLLWSYTAACTMLPCWSAATVHEALLSLMPQSSQCCHWHLPYLNILHAHWTSLWRLLI